MPDQKFRTVKRLDSAAGEWVDIEFKDIKVGDRVRLFEAGKCVSDCIAATEPVAWSDVPGNMGFRSAQIFEVLEAIEP